MIAHFLFVYTSLFTLPIWFHFLFDFTSILLSPYYLQPIKAPAPEPRLQTSNSVLHKVMIFTFTLPNMPSPQGTVYETGDIVSLLDYSGGIYYALIRGFLIDQYATHYAILKWVLPKTPNPTHFDPRNFILGNIFFVNFPCHPHH